MPVSTAQATDCGQVQVVRIIEPQGKRTKRIVIKARFAAQADESLDVAVAMHLAKWGFFQEAH